MPRSGTKLLREILNAHPRVRIPEIETEFFPYWAKNWKKYEACDTARGFQQFYHACLHYPYFSQLADRGHLIRWTDWYGACNSYEPAGVFEGLIRATTGIASDNYSILWGDKSPSNIRHIPLLKEHFPNARFVHIIRDVRDYCLSVHKAWGKSSLRAAQRWQDDVSKAREDGLELAESYLEVRYEDLVTHPLEVLPRICSRLELEFTEQMLTFRAAENIGAAKGKTNVLSTNISKYSAGMKPRLAAQVEMICCDSLRNLGYPCTYSGPQTRVPDWKLCILRLFDGFATVRAMARKRGFLYALRFQSRYFRVSGNRFN